MNKIPCKDCCEVFGVQKPDARRMELRTTDVLKPDSESGGARL